MYWGKNVWANVLCNLQQYICIRIEKGPGSDNWQLLSFKLHFETLLRENNLWRCVWLFSSSSFCNADEHRYRFLSLSSGWSIWAMWVCYCPHQIDAILSLKLILWDQEVPNFSFPSQPANEVMTLSVLVINRQSQLKGVCRENLWKLIYFRPQNASCTCLFSFNYYCALKNVR